MDWLRSYKRGVNEYLIKPEIMLFSVVDAEGMAGANQFAAEAWKLRVPSIARLDLSEALELGPSCTTAMLGLRLPSGIPTPTVRQRTAEVLKGVAQRGQALLLELPQAPWADLLPALQAAVEAVEAQGLENALLCLRGFQPSELLHLNRAAVAWLDARARRYPAQAEALDTDEAADEVMLSASTLFGALLLDGVGDALLVESSTPNQDSVGLCYNIPQATGVRITKTRIHQLPFLRPHWHL